jgi:hypothetical protein
MGKTVIASIAVVAMSFIGTGSHATAAPPQRLNCTAGQTIVFNGTTWGCADFPTGAGLTGLERVQADFPANSGDLSTIATQEVFAECPPGKKVVGGGYLHFFGGDTGTIRTNVPTIDGDGWIVDGTNFLGNPWRLSAVAMCADAE